MQKFKDIVQIIRRLNWKMKVLGLLIFLFFIFLITVAIAPLHKMQEYENLVRSDSLFLETYQENYNQPELRLLVKEKAYKEALLKLSESDSIQLVINLSDSTVNLSINGVMIHQTKAGSFEEDRMLKKMPLMQQVKIFSQPLAVQSQYATIVKDPVVVRHAPKDTLEAALNAWQPDTLIQKPAFLILSTDLGIHVIFQQENNPALGDKWKKLNFYSRLGIRSATQAVYRFVTLKKQEYHPVLTIKMPADDLRAIYRALPEHTFVVITI
jgi:hypothetical protein